MRSCRAILGVAATVPQAAADHFDHAALAIGFAVLFDGVDGRMARMTSTTSDFGKELDSLADVITFGVAPSLLAYIWGFRMLPQMPVHATLRDQLVHAGVFVCFLFLICGASRLARFNISINPQPRNPGRPGHKYFVGMPIPAGAGVIASIIHFREGGRLTIRGLRWCWLCLIVLTGYLMVSSWRFWSGKEIAGGRKAAVPDGGADGDAGRADCAVFGVDADDSCAWVFGIGCAGAAGVLVEQGS